MAPGAAVWNYAHLTARHLGLVTAAHAPRSVENYYADLTGVSPRVQRERVRGLFVAHGTAPLDAYRYGLLGSDGEARWARYVYRYERGWNITASAILFRSGAVQSERPRVHFEALADKARTAQILTNIGVPVPPHVCVDRHATTPGIQQSIDSALSRWGGQVFAKPRRGSGSAGAFVITGKPGCFETRHAPSAGHGTTLTAIDARSAMRGHDYLLQPLLRTQLQGETLPDTLNLRLVTRDAGEGPEVFSIVAEVPFLRADGKVGFAPLRLHGSSLTSEDAGQSRWLPPRPRSRRRLAAERYAGSPIDGLDSVKNHARVSHRAFAGVFAIAWDVAMTTDGPIFLEGNTGFAPETPQLDAGGLLAFAADLTAPHQRPDG